MPEYFATVARGLETIAATELEKLGAKSVNPEFTGVRFTGDRALLYRVNLWARTIFRVLMPIADFRCKDARMLYREIAQIEWEKYLTPEQTLAVKATGKNRQLNHTHFTALQVKNAIVDRQRDHFGSRSNVDTENPDLLVNLHVNRDRAVLSLDTTGNSLHRRGYHPAMGKAPLKESLAAAILEMAEYSPDLPFFDPLCGSGTLPIEAALKAKKIAPGLFRDRFTLMNFPDFDDELWQQLLTEAEAAENSELPAPIYGTDGDGSVLAEARVNALNCGLGHQIEFRQQEFAQIEAPGDRGLLICNPPYGERLGNAEELGDFYQLIGDILKQRFTGWTAYILSGNKELTKRIGLRTSRRIPFYNGSLPCTLLKYELY
ncbi:RNA methyltransferase [Oxynema sp. CENA135]|uniref:THUMP domain-containing class I SAM-dependent RNA methyltransferase n=1 Tax=Oxynema sp. CENA135 TaxID=984206 RepID=UPI00190B28F2|nr:THUMP domain-containing protein [Oxynema sp. CENA135]MBK4729765.1 RNA methyltransferase [Oxynema sp. CENA135]